MQAILLSIGDELVLGQTVDTNTAWLAQRLIAMGIHCIEHRTVHDDQDAVARAITQTAKHCDLLIITGGLGPTDDDLTRQALAQAMDVELVEDPKSIAAIEAIFKKLGRAMPEQNRSQAMHPAGSAMIPNSCGTAPGLRAQLGQATIYVTPGVPREMEAMVKASVEPELRQCACESGHTARTILTAKLNTFGSGESDIAQRLGDLMSRERNPLVGTTVSAGQVSVRVRAEYESASEAADAIAQTIAKVESKLGALAFGRDETAIQDTVIALLVKEKKTIATAESCTGGLIASMLTDVPGSSAAVVGGWVTYANAMKTDQVDVPPQLIQQHGAVSGQVVQAMAAGAIERSGADFAISTSGVAGPGGGTPDKPVGTVWIGLAWRQGGAIVTDAWLARLTGNRAAIRDRAGKCALQLLRLHLMGQPLDLVRWVSRG